VGPVPRPGPAEQPHTLDLRPVDGCDHSVTGCGCRQSCVTPGTVARLNHERVAPSGGRPRETDRWEWSPVTNDLNGMAPGDMPGGGSPMSVGRRVVLAFVAVFVANGLFGGDRRASGALLIGGVVVVILLVGWARWIRGRRT
jgi:hypothetical protein